MSAPTLETIEKEEWDTEVGDTNYVETNEVLAQCELARQSRIQKNKDEDDKVDVAFNQDDSMSTDEEMLQYFDAVNKQTDEESDPSGDEEEASLRDEAVDSAPEADVEESASRVVMHGHDCCICLTEIEDEELIGCSGTEVHYWHAQCGLEYVKGEIGVGRAFEGVRTQQLVDLEAQEPLTSQPGQLPCPAFGAGCDCAFLPHNTVFRVAMTDDTYDTCQQYMEAFRRVNIREANAAEQENSNNNNDVEAADNNQDQVVNVDGIYRRVVDALSRGFYMTCPNCRSPGQKDLACIHIECRSCGAQWCYCCGRFRQQSGPPHAHRCRRQCDSTSIYLEGQPGWGTFARHELGEDPKQGALMEFHHRVMAYYVRGIKEATPPAVWEEFRQAHPTVLQNTPTPGRHILWNEIDSSQPPVFGSTVENDLMWKLPPLQQRRQDAEGDEQQQQDPEDPGSFWQVLTTDKGKMWIVLLFFSILFLILRLTIGSPGLKVVADISVALASFSGFSYTLVWCANFFASHPNHELCQGLPEALFIGKFGQVPLVSSGSRFGSALVYFWVGSIALGSLLIGGYKALGSSLPTLQIMGMIVLVFGLTCFAVAFAVGNMSPTPQNNDDYMSFVRVSLFSLLLIAVGAGLKTADAAGAKTAGIFLLCLGIGVFAAEYVPRLFRGLVQYNVWMPLFHKTRRIGYIFFLSVTIGSALLWLGQYSGSMGPIAGGIAFIVFGVVYAFVAGARS